MIKLSDSNLAEQNQETTVSCFCSYLFFILFFLSEV